MATLAEIIAETKWEVREDYGHNMLIAWDDRLETALGWECETGLCNGEEDDEAEELDPDDPDGVYHGWAKWQRLERSPDGRVLVYIECGHCGHEVSFDEQGDELSQD